MSNDILDWDDLSDSDKSKAQKLMNELHELFNKYAKIEKDTEPCEDSTSTE